MCKNSQPSKKKAPEKIVKPANMVAVEELVSLTYKYISDCREISSRLNKPSSFTEGGFSKTVSKDDKVDMVLTPGESPINFDELKKESTNSITVKDENLDDIFQDICYLDMVLKQSTKLQLLERAVNASFALSLEGIPMLKMLKYVGFDSVNSKLSPREFVITLQMEAMASMEDKE